MLDFITTYKTSVELFGLQYKALLISARDQTHLLENEYNSGVISRIGFVVQDIRNLENEISSVIQNRSSELSNAECIFEAQRTLESLSLDSGNAISRIMQELVEQINEINESIIHPIFDEIEFLISVFQFEILNVFSYYNSVTNMFTLLTFLESEIRLYGNLFEYFVNDIYVDLYIYGVMTNELNRIAFPQLNDVLEDFEITGSSIISSLSDCI